MRNILNWRVVILVPASALALIGCEHQETVPAEPKPISTVEQQRYQSPHRAEDTTVIQQTPASPVQRHHFFQNPVAFSFDPASVVLAEADLAVLEDLKERITAAERITIRGFCDKTYSSKAVDIAIARSVAVRTELLRLGVKPSSIRIRYSTVTTRHAAEIEFQAGS